MSATTTPTTGTAAPQTPQPFDPEPFAERFFGAGIAGLDLIAVYIGDRLGFYELLATGGPLTSGDLAAAAGTDERYTREWLEHQAVGGVLRVDDASAGAETRRYGVPEGLRGALTDPDDPAHVARPMAQAMIGVAMRAPALIDAFRTGDGVPYESFGADVREGGEGLNRPAFTNLLCQSWLPAMPDLHARLALPGARVAELACGGGWASIALARGYLGLRVDGYDLDEASVDAARANVRAAGVDDRVRIAVRDATDEAPAGGYDLVCVFEAIHDMARPVEALRTARAMAAPDGEVLVVDERAADVFTAPGDDLERFLYGASIALCLPTGRAEHPSEATGTVMRPDVLRDYARRAGFTGVDEAPIDYPFWRFYRLHG